MFQCTAEPWWVFKASAEAMAKDYHVYLFIADGHDEQGTEFVSLEKTVRPGCPLYDEMQQGSFVENTVEEYLQEEELLLSRLSPEQLASRPARYGEGAVLL